MDRTGKMDFRAQEDKIAERLSRIRKKIMVISGKGGVGKTTISVNLALQLCAKGYSVGLLDADIHGPNVPLMLGLEGNTLTTYGGGTIEPISVKIGKGSLKVVSIGFLLESRDTPVIWRGPLKAGVIRQFLSDVNWGELDFLVVDLPPGTGDEPLSIAQLIKGIDGAIVVTTPQEVSLLDSVKSLNFAKRLGVKVLGVVENMSGFVCPNCGFEVDLFKKGGGEKVAKEYGVPFLGRIPIDPKMVEVEDSGRLSTEFMDSPSPFFKVFRNVVDEVLKNLEAEI
ncbi:MAG: P-loop NTPase [Thermosulfidibacteraceae bacterium]|jgi:Mrp family chromosome partitioning ATPase